MKETVSVKDGIFSMSMEENGYVVSACPQDMDWVKHMLIIHGVDMEAEIRNILNYEMQAKKNYEAKHAKKANS